MRCTTGSRFTDLCPNEFGRVQFGRTGGKLIPMNPWVTREKIFYRATTMDRMLIPNHDDGSLDVTP